MILSVNLTTDFSKYIHRSLIVNKDKIVKYNPKLNKLEFNDGSFTHLISRRKKKELMKCD